MHALYSKIRNYCLYQERAHSDVRNYLLQLEIYGDTLETIMAQLIQDNLLNEERFAIQYARGKFRIKHWGKIKIQVALKQKNISDYIIKKALQHIDSDEYIACLLNLYRKHFELYQKANNKKIATQKTIQYLMQKGYEYSMIKEIMHQAHE